MTTIVMGLICFLIAAFAIMTLLFIVDIIRGAITRRESKLCKGWLCIIEAILGFVIAACAAIILPVIVLLLLYIVFMILFG